MTLSNDVTSAENLYLDAINRTEPACVYYLRRRFEKTPIIQQPQEYDKPKMAYLGHTKIIMPDISVHSIPFCIFVEVKAKDEFVPDHLFGDNNENYRLRQLSGWERFNYLRKHGYEQGLSKKKYDEYMFWQKKTERLVIIAMNDLNLQSYDNNRGVWYGCPVSYFSPEKYGKPVHFRRAGLHYNVAIAQMVPIENLIRCYRSIQLIGGHEVVY